MNFLAIAANKLKNNFDERFGGGADTPMSRMANAFGLTHAPVDTPQGLQNPEQFARGIGGAAQNAMPGIDPAQATSQQEAMAKQNGFRSYGEMLAWAKQRQSQTGGTIQGQGTQGQPSQRPAPPPGGPGAVQPGGGNFFNYILDRWRGAVGGQ